MYYLSPVTAPSLITSIPSNVFWMSSVLALHTTLDIFFFSSSSISFPQKNTVGLEVELSLLQTIPWTKQPWGLVVLLIMWSFGFSHTTWAGKNLVNSFLCTVSPRTKNNCLSSLFACHIQAINNLCVRTTPLSRASCLQIVQHTISISFRLQRTSTHPNQDLYSISGSIVCTWIFQLFQKNSFTCFRCLSVKRGTQKWS